jgi:hypothetical protein
MASKVMRHWACCLALISPFCYGKDNARTHYTPIQYLKNYALSSCIADGYQSKDVIDDATAAANGYKELGSLDIDAYNEALALSRKFLAKEYLSKSDERLVIMKCIDFYHSAELDRLARKYASKK